MPPGFRRTSNPTNSFKLLAAVLVILLYFIITHFTEPARPPRDGADVQWEGFSNGTTRGEKEKADKVVEAMKHTFWSYKMKAWGADGLLPVSGDRSHNRNGWGAFIVESASTLAIMGLWDELELALEHIMHAVDFETSNDLVDPYETTIRYLGGMLSLIDMVDAGLIPKQLLPWTKREAILAQAVVLANKLGPSFDSPTGMPWPRVNFKTNKGLSDPLEELEKGPDKKQFKNPSLNPARIGTNIVEYRVLSRLTHDPIYLQNSTRAWSSLIWHKYQPPVEGMVNSPVDIVTGDPVGRQYHWDIGHGSFYEYLLKITLLSPKDRYAPMYEEQWIKAAHSLRKHLASRNRPAESYPKQHLYMSQQDGPDVNLNKQSHSACFAAGNVLLGGAHSKHKGLITFGQALLEACRHAYETTATGLGPESWAWFPKFGAEEAAYFPQSDRQKTEWSENGFWTLDAKYRLRPEYAESLFHAFRVTGEERYREWAWDAFEAIEKFCKTQHGYAGLKDIMALPGENDASEDAIIRPAEDSAFQHFDESDGHWVAETLKYFWLLFTDPEVATLDRWVFSAGGHPFRMIR